MNSTHQPRVRRGLAHAAAVLLLAATACVTLTAQPASAYTDSGWGHPGYAVPLAPVHNGLHGLVAPITFVGRSPAGYDTQFVTARMHVNQWLPGQQQWVRIRTERSTISMFPGQLWGAIPTVTTAVDSGYYYNVEIEVVWEDGYGGTFGTSAVSFVAPGDYRCGYSACTIGQGWIHF